VSSSKQLQSEQFQISAALTILKVIVYFDIFESIDHGHEKYEHADGKSKKEKYICPIPSMDCPGK